MNGRRYNFLLKNSIDNDIVSKYNKLCNMGVSVFVRQTVTQSVFFRVVCEIK